MPGVVHGQADQAIEEFLVQKTVSRHEHVGEVEAESSGKNHYSARQGQVGIAETEEEHPFLG